MNTLKGFLSEQEREELRGFLNRRNSSGCEHGRAAAILHLDKGKSVPQAAEITFLDEQTIRSFVERYKNGGIDGLIKDECGDRSFTPTPGRRDGSADAAYTHDEPAGGSLQLDYLGIHEYQMNRFPYLLIDRAEEIFPGKSSKGYKNLTANEWFFPPHFAGDPCMPGMLQMEALVQMSSLAILTLPGYKSKTLYLHSVQKMKLSKKLLPGDCFRMETAIRRFNRNIAWCSGTGYESGEAVCGGEWVLTVAGAVVHPRRDIP